MRDDNDDGDRYGDDDDNDNDDDKNDNGVDDDDDDDPFHLLIFLQYTLMVIYLHHIHGFLFKTYFNISIYILGFHNSSFFNLVIYSINDDDDDDDGDDDNDYNDNESAYWVFIIVRFSTWLSTISISIVTIKL